MGYKLLYGTSLENTSRLSLREIWQNVNNVTSTSKILVPKYATQKIARSETESDTNIDNIESQTETNGEDIADSKGELNEIQEKLQACS